MKTYNDSGIMGVSLLVILLLHLCHKGKVDYLSAVTVFIVLSIPAYSLAEAFLSDEEESFKTTKLDLLLKANL